MAIAYDTSITPNYSASGTTNTVSFTCTGSNRILFVVTSHHSTSPASVVTGVTYAGVAMTLIRTYQSANGKFDLWYLIAPATGTNNIVSTLNTSDANYIIASSYTGVDQTSPIDVSGDGGPTTTGSYSQSLTTTVDNCWAIMVGGAYNGSTLTAGSNTVLRQGVELGLTGTFLGDSGTPKTPAGTQTLAFTSASQNYTTIMASFKPVQNINVTANAGVVSATFSTPAPTVTAIENVTASASVVSAVFSTPAPAISGGANVSSSVVSATFSLPAPNIITPDSLIDASVVTAVFSLPSPTVEIDTSFSVGVVTSTFSIPASSVQIDFTHDSNVFDATFSLPAPIISAESNITISAGVVVAIFSTQAPTVSAEQNGLAEPSVLTATFSLPTPTVTAIMNVSIDATVVSATFSLNTPTKIGGLWTAQERNEGVWTPQARVI